MRTSSVICLTPSSDKSGKDPTAEASVTLLLLSAQDSTVSVLDPYRRSEHGALQSVCWRHAAGCGSLGKCEVSAPVFRLIFLLLACRPCGVYPRCFVVLCSFVLFFSFVLFSFIVCFAASSQQFLSFCSSAGAQFLFSFFYLLIGFFRRP